MTLDDAAPAVDSAAFAHVFDEWFDQVYAFVARRVQDRDAAEEVTARTFQRAVEELRGGHLTLDGLAGFLLRVAGSAVLDHARRLRRSTPSGMRATDLDDDGDAQAALWLADVAAGRAFEAAIDGSRLRRSVAGLDDEQRRLVLLRYLDGLDADGMAAVVGCSPEQAALGLHRALATLHPTIAVTDANVA